jgi:hypothetical protein
MQGIKERIQQAKELAQKIQLRRQEVQAKATEAQAARTKNQAQQKIDSNGWYNPSNNYSSNFDDLEEKFQRWETQDELEQMKRKMGK